MAALPGMTFPTPEPDTGAASGHPPDLGGPDQGDLTVPVPSRRTVIAAGAWAYVFGVLSMVTTDDVRIAAFIIAAWPPLVALLLPMRRIRPEAHWVRMAWGVVCFPLAASIELLSRRQGWVTFREGGISDLVYALGYFLLASGVWTLVRRHGRDEVRAGLVDGAVMLIPPLVLTFQYVAYVPDQTEGVADWGLRLLVAIYPLLDIALLVALVWLLATPTLTRSHLSLLVAAMILTLVIDVMFAFEALTSNLDLRLLAEGLYPLSYALLAAGVATGASTRVGPPRTTGAVHWGRVGVLSFGAILGPAVVVVAAMPPEPLPVLAVAISVVVISLFLVYRLLDLARILGVTTIQLARARRELQVQATHDPLTGLLNRAVLDDVLDSAMHPGAPPAALLSIDLDEFKAVNDTYGHLAGDAVLRAVARRLRRVVRAEDLVLRTGGDEFLAVLRDVRPEEAHSLAQRIVTAVEEPVHHDGVDLRVSASVGVALLDAQHPVESLEASIARADAAMYEAKRSGSRTMPAAAHEPTARDHRDTSATADTAPGDTATVGRDDDANDRTPTRPGTS